MSLQTCSFFPVIWLLFTQKRIQVNSKQTKVHDYKNVSTFSPRIGQMCLGWERQKYKQEQGAVFWRIRSIS